MKKIIFAFLLFFAFFSMSAQEITGDWKGVLKVPGAELNLVLHVIKSENGLSAILDSPDQKALGIPVTTTTFENATLKFTVSNLTIEYEGILDKNQIITGTFKQMGQAFPLIFKR